MLHLHEEEFQTLAGHVLIKERGSLICDLATRLHDCLKGGRGGGCKAYLHQDIQAQGREEVVPLLPVSGDFRGLGMSRSHSCSGLTLPVEQTSRPTGEQLTRHLETQVHGLVLPLQQLVQGLSLSVLL